MVCLSVIMEPGQWGGPGLLGAVEPPSPPKKKTVPLHTKFNMLRDAVLATQFQHVDSNCNTVYKLSGSPGLTRRLLRRRYNSLFLLVSSVQRQQQHKIIHLFSWIIRRCLCEQQNYEVRNLLYSKLSYRNITPLKHIWTRTGVATGNQNSQKIEIYILGAHVPQNYWVHMYHRTAGYRIHGW